MEILNYLVYDQDKDKLSLLSYLCRVSIHQLRYLMFLKIPAELETFAIFPILPNISANHKSQTLFQASMSIKLSLFFKR